MYGTENNELELIVDRNGILISKLGNLVRNDFGEIREYLTRRVLEQMIGVNVNVSMGRLRSINVLRTRIILFLHYQRFLKCCCCGLTEIGSLRDIQVLESGIKNQLLMFISFSQTGGDIRLKSGDVTIPPIKKVVMIDGTDLDATN